MLRYRVTFPIVVATLLVWPAVDLAREQVAPAQAEHGSKVFAAQKCSICHSIAGLGNKKLPLDGVGAKLTVDQIQEWIVAPTDAAKKASSTAKPLMRAYPKLPKADLDALVGYLKTLDKK